MNHLHPACKRSEPPEGMPTGCRTHLLLCKWFCTSAIRHTTRILSNNPTGRRSFTRIYARNLVTSFYINHRFHLAEGSGAKLIEIDTARQCFRPEGNFMLPGIDFPFKNPPDLVSGYRVEIHPDI